MDLLPVFFAGWPSLARIALVGVPTYLVRHGRMLRDAMKKERVTDSEVLAAIRKNGVDSVQSIAAVILETDGSFSVIRNVSAWPTALADVQDKSRGADE
jgi:uncharacterized membrane protein YcaP (DUF421 family)